MKYDEFIIPSLRLNMLRILAEAPAYTANESLLHNITCKVYGFDGSRDRIRTQLAWLEEQGLASVARECPTCMVATLTERGLDAAQGRAFVPGVDRPKPGM
jgi:hypothetical protein